MAWKSKSSVRNTLKSAESPLSVLICLSLWFSSTPVLLAGDILRGGAPAGRPGTGASGGAASAAQAAAAARLRANSNDALARTTQAVKSVRGMQAAARAHAANRDNLGLNPNQPGVQLPNVPDGLNIGGLVPSSGLAGSGSANPVTDWLNAETPTQTSSGGNTTVTVRQTAQQALLNWKSFNIGRKTKLKFDQSAGGANQSKWIAFNKVSDPSGVPSQILGSIEAPGQVYVVNQNGVIFGGTSQINTHVLTVSTLPLNPNLFNQGLLNNPDAQFLFSAHNLPGGSDGMAAFVPEPAFTPNGKPGDVIVQKGAWLQSPVNNEGKGGRIMLVGSNVINEGTISTPSGQTILAAGSQVGVAAHPATDPSLRGLDVWVGAVDVGAGTVTNTGEVSATMGAITFVGKEIKQNGVLESSTSVDLNGRIDLLANYGAVSNPNFDNAGTPGFGGPQFFNQFTGLVTLGEGSVTRILPANNKTSTPGLKLTEASQVNFQGLAINVKKGAMVLAPSGKMNLSAGTWPFSDTDGDGTIIGPGGTVDPLLLKYYSEGKQRFLFSEGQVYIEPSALMSVAGSVDVFVPLAQHILSIEMRGSELADSPLQRLGALAAILLTVDLRKTGDYFGRYWMGTPLGDATGFAALIERNIAQKTAAGGSITINAGESIVIRKGATLDVSGGYFRNEGGLINTTRLLQGGNIVDISNADPSQIYDGIYSPEFWVSSPRWGVSKQYLSPLAVRSHYEPEYLSGAPGGVLSLSAPSMAISGELRGTTLHGERQRSNGADLAALNIAFRGEKIFSPSAGQLFFLPHSPTPPKVTFLSGSTLAEAESFQFSNDAPAPLRPDLLADVYLSPSLLDEDNFGHLSVENVDGDIVVPKGVKLKTAPRGSIAFSGANIRVAGSLLASGGALNFSTYNLSPTAILEFGILNPGGAVYPLPNIGRGLFELTGTGRLSVAGTVVDERNRQGMSQLKAINGGSITVNSFDARLQSGSLADVSGGVTVSPRGAVSYGTGGSLSLIAGRDSVLPTSYGSGAFRIVGGSLALNGKLQGYSGTRGGTLAVQSSLIEVGSRATQAGALLIKPEFFQTGGFSSYALTGIGAPSSAAIIPGQPAPYQPGLFIAPGTRIRPLAESLLAMPNALGGLSIQRHLQAEGLRSPVSLSFGATGFDNSFTDGILEIRGDLVMSKGASIRLDAGASASFNAQTVTLLGEVSAPAGKITISGASSFPLPAVEAAGATHALATVYIGPSARLSARGTSLRTPDAYGRRTGSVYSGGTISVSGNIVADQGAILDVSGTSAKFDVPLWMLGINDMPNTRSGLTAPLSALATQRTRIDSSGGLIDLAGSQMLFSDATLLGNSGGPNASGGWLSIFSGRFYTATSARTSADINLVVTQSGNVIPGSNSNLGIGIAILDDALQPISGMGYFAADRFLRGGFDSLDLGATFLESAAPIRFGGNVRFNGPVSIAARGALRVAGGGVVEAESPVRLSATYLAVGQPFRPPENPGDLVVPFQQTLAATPDYYLTPTHGTGNLSLSAGYMDVGTLVLQKIGAATFSARNDMRGNGTVSIAGDLTLQAGQIYPTALSKFNLFAYDHSGGTGSITVLPGRAKLSPPLTAGGQLGLYASSIIQGGTLRSPLGSIILGWDGNDMDPSTTDLDAPYNPVVGTLRATPITQNLTLKAGSITSVSAVLPSGETLIVPFGISPDGTSWIAPDGTNVTLTGLPGKEIRVMGANVVTETGSLLDIRGGGDLAAYRWVSGTGGSTDLLGSPSGNWNASTSYKTGTLVSYQGSTWSARADSKGITPSVSLYWTRLPESYAILPSNKGKLFPYAPFNTGTNAGALQGDPGFVDSSLKWGDSIYLSGSPGLGAGKYSLLPKRYALLPGAFLVTAASTGGTALDYITPEGAAVVPGYRLNTFSAPQASGLYNRYEVASRKIVAGRVLYEGFSANAFMPAIAQENNVTQLQRLPMDAGHLVLHGNTGLNLQNSLLARAAGGRGAMVDLSSTADLWITDGAPGGSGITLDAGLLSSWGAESLLIGGVRQFSASGINVNVRTNSLTVDNAGTPLQGSDLILVSRNGLTLADGAVITATGSSITTDPLEVRGDGALIRVSSDVHAEILRTGLTGATTPLLTLGANSALNGAAVVLDSSYGTRFNPLATFDARALTLGSGQVSIVLSGDDSYLPGSVVAPHLVLSGQLMADVQLVETLKIKSYTSIDFYGTGTLGNPTLNLEFASAGIRGFEQAGGTVRIQSRETLFTNPSGIAALPAPGSSSGSLVLESETIRIGTNDFMVSGYNQMDLLASNAVLGQGKGSFTTQGHLTIRTPLITGASGSVQGITATGTLNLESPGGASSITPGLGAILTLTGAEVNAGTLVHIPSGRLHLRATSGDINVTGNLDAAGIEQRFFDLTRYTDAGEIILQSDAGDVITHIDSVINLSAAAIGDAGTLRILTPEGHFTSTGTLNATAGQGGKSGQFILDTHSLPTLGDLNAVLDAGTFHASRRIRVRTGDVVMDGITRAHEVMLSADLGSLTVTGEIDASGETGGSITLAAQDDLIVSSGAHLTVRGKKFSSAGKGGSITLEAGATSNGISDGSAILDLSANGATLDLGVDEYIAGAFTTPGSSAFHGQFTGTLHLRAPRTASNNDLNLTAIGTSITGASSILAEGFEVYDITSSGGLITGWRGSFTALPNAGTLQRQVYDRANAFLNTGNHNAMMTRLLGSDSQGLESLLVLAPGVEILNRTGDLTLGSSASNATALGSASQNSGDWNLADFRFGPKNAPGVLTLRAAGDLNIFNALSDGFGGTLPAGTVAGNSLWLSPVMTAVNTLPLNLQSWSFRLVAGADLSAANFREVQSQETLGTNKGSLILGKYYGANLVSGANASTATAITNRYQVIRTGTGSIDIAAGRDIKLRNVFASIYTAGVALPTPTTVYSLNDFVIPSVAQTAAQHPDQGQFLGGAQQIFRPQWSMAGGHLNLYAQRDIGRYTLHNGVEITDTSRQLPTNWLYRRGYVDPATGLFGVGGVDGGLGRTVTDASASTTWWVDFSNFFQGLGALGGGDLTVIAGRDIINTDAVIPTNARMPGRVDNGGTLSNSAPDQSKLHELGGGNLTVRAGNNIDGGLYYVERGRGELFAGGAITTNERRSPSLGILGTTSFPNTIVHSQNPAIYDPLTWMPTLLYVGKSSFDVSAYGSVLLGPTANVFLTPQGVNNKFWYKTYFSTYAPEAAVSVASYGGDVTHRMAVTLPGETTPRSTLEAWMLYQNLFAGSAQRASNFQPWIRLAESDIVYFQTLFQLNAPTLESTAFGGDLNIVGKMTLFPSPTGSLELAAAGAINGLNPSGKTIISSRPTTVWTAASINLSDADPTRVPGVASPLAYHLFSGRAVLAARESRIDPFSNVDPLFEESGSYSGKAGTPAFQQMLHTPGILHRNDPNPVRLYAAGGDLSGLTLFSPKQTRILASENIGDIAFYLQNTDASDISLIAAGRDITAYNENSVLRSLASNFALGNTVGDLEQSTATGGKSKVLSGDIQINGPGTLEVFAGRNLNLGTGTNFADGTGVGITSIGNFRNPFLPFEGANLIVGAGLGLSNGLAGGDMDFASFIDRYIVAPQTAQPDYLGELGLSLADFQSMDSERQATVALEVFYRVLRDSGRAFATGDAAPYVAGQEAIATLFPAGHSWKGEIHTRARDIRTTTGGSISIIAPGGDVTMASDIFGNPLTPPGIVTEYGGNISIFTDGNVDIGRARIFTLRGGDITIWSSSGNIAAGTSPKTVVTASPTRVVIDITSADVATDLGGLATGGGIGVLASVPGIAPGSVDLIAPSGMVDAGDAGIRSTGSLSIAAVTVMNAGNIQATGGSTGVPGAAAVAAPNITGITAATSASSAVNSTSQNFAQQKLPTAQVEEEEEDEASLFSVEVVGYGG